MRSIRNFIITLTIWIPAFAGMTGSVSAETVTIQLSTGTGFFVSDDGYIITNHHVVKPCEKDIEVQNHLFRAIARLEDTSSSDDLALIKIDRNSPSVATFRSQDEPLAMKERIVVMGYPLAGTLTTQEGVVEGNTGPRGEQRFMQFTNLVKKGNSGGPLMDTAGRIVGVVTAKAKATSYNEARGRQETVLETDLAIPARALLGFMNQNRIQPRFSFGGVPLAADRIQDQQKDAVVKVTCRVD